MKRIRIEFDVMDWESPEQMRLILLRREDSYQDFIGHMENSMGILDGVSNITIEEVSK